MNCPKCNSKLVNGCCIKCGYLSNGNQIENKNIDKNEDLKLFNKDFDKLNLNKNLLLVFILGSLYFSYMGYFFLGTILGILNYFLFYFVMNNIEISISIFGTLPVGILYFFINRLLYIIVANYICLQIDKVKIKIIKTRYKDQYKEKLNSHRYHKYYLFITIVIYVILILMFIISRRIKNGLL